MLYRAHSWARLWFAGTMLALVLMQQTIVEGLALLLLLTVLLRIFQGDFTRISTSRKAAPMVFTPHFLTAFVFYAGCFAVPCFYCLNDT